MIYALIKRHSGQLMVLSYFTLSGRVSGLIIDSNSVFSFFMQQVGNMGPTDHVQSPRDPFQARRRFLAPAPRQRHFNLIPFAPGRQVRFFPGEG